MSLLVVFIVSLLFCFVFVSGISGDGGWWGEHSGSLMGKCLQHATSGEYLSEAACHTSKALLHRPEKRLCHVWTFVWGPNILRLKYQSKYLLTESKSCHYKMGLFCGQPLTSQQRVSRCSVGCRVLEPNRTAPVLVHRAGLLSAAPAVRSFAATRAAWRPPTTWCSKASPTCAWSVETAVWREPTSSGRNGAACWRSWWSEVPRTPHAF